MAATSSRAHRVEATRLLAGLAADDAFSVAAEYARYAEVGAEDQGLSDALTDLYNLRFG